MSHAAAARGLNTVSHDTLYTGRHQAGRQQLREQLDAEQPRGVARVLGREGGEGRAEGVGGDPGRGRERHGGGGGGQERVETLSRFVGGGEWIMVTGGHEAGEAGVRGALEDGRRSGWWRPGLGGKRLRTINSVLGGGQIEAAFERSHGVSGRKGRGAGWGRTGKWTKFSFRRLRRLIVRVGARLGLGGRVEAEVKHGGCGKVEVVRRIHPGLRCGHVQSF